LRVGLARVGEARRESGEAGGRDLLLTAGAGCGGRSEQADAVRVWLSEGGGGDVECGRGEVVALLGHEQVGLCLGVWQKGFICQPRTDTEWSKF